jgi:RecB family exonuclease
MFQRQVEDGVRERDRYTEKMLRLARLSSPTQKKQFLESFDPNAMSWIVSDLRTKFEIQKIFLQGQGYFQDLSVLRASELWRYLLRRARPELRLVSSDFVRTSLKESLKAEDLRLSQNADAVVADFIDSFIAVHSHPLGHERMQEWFLQHPESLSRWGGWYLLSKKYVEQFLSQNRLAPRWVAGLLQNETQLFGAFWQRPLVVDLGSQLSRTEAELFLEIAKVCEVTVLIPETMWSKDFSYLLEGYRLLEGQPHEKVAVKKATHSTAHKKAYQFSGLLGECKAAVEQVRRWLEGGITADAIAVIAPDIETYWPMLAPLLTEEGIPVAKEQTFRLQTLPQVSQWLSRLRLSSRQVSFADLENAVYLPDPFVRYEEFHALFAEILGEEDLVRHEKIRAAFAEKLLPTESIDRDTFLGFALRAWKDTENLSALEICLREFLMNADDRLTLSVSSWIYLLEQIIAKKETRWKAAVADGVQVTNLSSADSVILSHRIFLGLCESQLKEKKNLLLDPMDVNSLATEIGFYIEHPEVSSLEFDLRWLAENDTEESLYFYPQSGVSGSAEAASSFWISVASTEPMAEVSWQPGRLRWDARQRTSLEWLETESQWPLASLRQTQDRIEEDLGLRELPAVKLSRLPSLSPTSFERYRQCPFVFAAEKLFGLLDLPLVDLDLDRRQRGALAHALLEKISVEPFRPEWPEQEIEAILEQLRHELKLQVHDEFSWRSLKEKHLRLSQRFLHFEKKWRELFPATRTQAREKAFQFHIDLATGEWRASGEESSSVLVRGKIDRIDGDGEGRAVIMDYKLSGGKLKSVGQWIEENQLQLALYSLALESGLVPDFDDVEVVSAVYMVLKNMSRDQGLKVREHAGPLFAVDRKRNHISTEEKAAIFTEVGRLIFSLVQDIAAGKIAPQPREKKDCDHCVWRWQCRAPHLNL